MKLRKVLSARIKSLREASGLSQQEVAERGELSLSLVAKLEQGKKADPRASTLLALAGALGVKPGQLLDDLFPPEPEPEPKPKAATATSNGHEPTRKKKPKKPKKPGKR